ncbi:MAG: nitroreductase family protein [Candidatus Diapherotrites archaeon]
MDFFEVLKKRVSVRRFKEKPLGKGALEKIFSSIISAPSAGNLQSFKVIAVECAEKKKELSCAAFRNGSLAIAEAPIVLVFLADPKNSAAQYGERGETLYALQDATIACSYAQLAAEALGLSSVWVGAFDEEKAGKTLGLKGASPRPIAILPIGYANEQPERRSRKKTNDLISSL